MNQSSSSPSSRLPLLLFSAAALLTTGCGLGSVAAPGPVSAVTTFQGAVHGGQQPVVGATIQLYVAGSTGYGSAASALIPSSVKTTAGGAFTITGTYTCNPSDLVYITATGGNPGVSGTQNNSALTLMTGLGPCSSISAGTSFIQINELTSVASVWALAPFMSNITHVGTSATNVAGLTNAFAAINNLVNTSTGASPGLTLPAGATLPTAEINTLADILAACVNTVDASGTQSSTCQSLFSATATAAITPNDTVQSAINLAHNPTLGLTLGTSLVTPTSPFQTTLSSAPTSWTIAINYTGAGITTPNGIAADAAGNIWTSNTSSVSKLSPTGAAISGGSGFTAGSLNLPIGIAIDAAGNAWVANSGSNSLSQISSTGASGSNFTGGGLATPRLPAIDAAGNVWVINPAALTVSEFTSTGLAISGPGGFTNTNLTTPVALAISPR
jgi:hypothetical protein